MALYVQNRANEDFGDYATRNYSVIPPAPEVASLMKYIDIPVSHFTGQPQIDIPIYTVKEGTLSVPISLSYKGGGIRQNELTGIISRGWTLMAGMTISRTVHGLPDECNKNTTAPNWMRGLFNLSSSDKELRNKLINRVEYYDPMEMNVNRVISYGDCYDYEAGYVDFANDIYKFYGMGMSGTFIFDENQQITMSTPSPIKLDSNLGWRNFGYSMTDKDKTSYIFDEGGVETTEIPISAEGYNLNVDFESQIEKLRYESAWHITQMKSLYGDVINFEYSEPIYRNEYLGVTQYYSYYKGGSWCYLIDKTSLSAMKNKYYERSLLAIKSESTTVKFHYGTDMKQLTAISIHKNDSDTTELWRYQIIRDSNGNMTQINQLGNSKTQELYAFQYNPKTCTSDYAIDHWGYCNGATSNTTILPEVNGLEFLPYKKADREPNEAYAKEGVLTAITYPMGGTTTLNWEQNDYSYIKDNNSYLQPNTQITTTQTISQLRGTQIDQNLTSGTYSMSSGDYFTINLSTYLSPIMNSASSFQTGFQTEYEDATHSDSYPRLDVYRNGAIYKQYHIDKNNSLSQITLTSDGAAYQFKLVNPRTFEGVSETDINNFWGATPTTAYENYGYITIVINTRTTTEDVVIRPWGGLRIASVVSNPTNGNSITKKYIYSKVSNGISYSNGVIKSIPKYSYQGGSYHQDATIGYEYASMLGVSSIGIPSTTDGEIGIEYSEVWESYSGATNGEIGYFYDTQREYPDVEDCLLGGYVPTGLKTLTSYAFKRGNFKEKQYYGFVDDQNPNNKSLYKKESYSYGILECSTTNTYTGPLHTVCDFSEINYSNGEDDIIYKNYTINKFKLIPYNKRIKTETVWEKDFYTDAETENTVTYTYYGEENGYNGNPWNSFIRTKSFINSRGQTVTTYYTYYKIGNIPLDLKELEVTVVGDIVVSARRNVYASNHKLEQTYSGCAGMSFSTNFTIPTSILGTAVYPSIDKKEFSYKYDSQGNIAEISYNGKVLASYLWGYMGKHPIVEAMNVTYDELFAVASRYGYNTDGIYSSDMSLFVESIRSDSSLAGKEVSTYTYHWLLGIATSTDSRGITSSYLLDDFGRLSGVKDNNGYFISKYDYNYKGF